MAVNKVTWQQVGHVTEPGSYMFRFGRLTISPQDLAIWKRYPNAAFTLVQTLSASSVSETSTDADDVSQATIEHYRLGAFELNEGPPKGEADHIENELLVEPAAPTGAQSSD